MVRTHINKIKPGKKVKIAGFLENIRDKKNLAFIVVRDITAKVQVTVFKPDASPDVLAALEHLTLDGVVEIEGKAVTNEGVKMGGLEIIPTKITVLSKAEALPINDMSDIDVRLDYRWVDLRAEHKTFIFKLQTFITSTLRQFFEKRNFIEIHSPKVINTPSESGANVFKLDYFGRDAFLAQSPQFYKQMAMAAGFESVFEIGPVFRAEKSYTSKHTTEFTGFDAEFSYINSYHDIIALKEQMYIDLLTKVKKQYGAEIKRLFDKDVVIPTAPFPKLKLAEVYALLQKHYGYNPESAQESDTTLEEKKSTAEIRGDLTTEAEQLTKKLLAEHFNHEFLFVTDYHKDYRAFYHKRCSCNSVSGLCENTSAESCTTPQGFDLIWRGVEIVTGAQREHRYDRLVAQAKEVGLDKDVEFYTEFFKYGCPPHGGFGLGLDRLTMLFLGINIKDVMFLFRNPNRLTP
ncbi:MAG: aspartate--tRNA(Asn) ligase [Firmicutes bacterium]|nr:aspartate--tRNA(Asn) ligase [Bacillota bacterium]